MTKKKAMAMSACDDNLMTYHSSKFAAAANPVSAANQSSVVNPAPATISKIDTNGCEGQIRNRLLTMKSIAAIVAAIAIAIAIAKRMVNLAFERIRRCLMCSMLDVAVSRQSLCCQRYQRYPPGNDYLSATPFYASRKFEKWRERLQKFVCKYPFRGSVRIYEDANISIFLVFKESVLKENLLAQKRELYAHNQD